MDGGVVGVAQARLLLVVLGRGVGVVALRMGLLRPVWLKSECPPVRPVVRCVGVELCLDAPLGSVP